MVASGQSLARLPAQGEPRPCRVAVGAWVRCRARPQAACPGLSVPPSPADCEALIRRMLAVDPARRIGIAQIRQHRWMQAGPAPPRASPAGPALSCSSSLGGYDEQVLGFMQTLGVDRQRTVEVGAALGIGGEAQGLGAASLGREALASPVPVGARANLRESFSKRHSRSPENNPGNGLVRGPRALKTSKACPL